MQLKTEQVEPINDDEQIDQLDSRDTWHKPRGAITSKLPVAFHLNPKK